MFIAHAMLTGYMPYYGVGPNGMIDANQVALFSSELEKFAKSAISEGRTSAGPKGTKPTDERVSKVLDESWTPKQGPMRDGVVPMSQLDWADQLGNGDRTIRQSGCCLTALTMAAGKITGEQGLNPRIANERIRAAGGFSGADLLLDRAASTLGVKVTGRSAITSCNSEKLYGQMDQSLAEGRPILAGVDYKSGNSSGMSNADHFVTITGKNPDGSYRAIDPAGGKEITFRKGKDGTYSAGKYKLVEVSFLEKA